MWGGVINTFGSRYVSAAPGMAVDSAYLTGPLDPTRQNAVMGSMVFFNLSMVYQRRTNVFADIPSPETEKWSTS